MTDFTDEELADSLTASIVDHCVDFFERGFHPAVPVDDRVVMTALARALAFGLVELHETDESAMETINRIMPIALAQERAFAATLPPDKPRPKLRLV